MSDCDDPSESPEGNETRVGVMVELRLPQGEEPATVLRKAALESAGFERDAAFEAVPMESEGEATVLVRGTLPEARLNEVEAQDGVAKVWPDTRVEPFAG